MLDLGRDACNGVMVRESTRGRGTLRSFQRRVELERRKERPPESTLGMS